MTIISGAEGTRPTNKRTSDAGEYSGEVRRGQAKKSATIETHQSNKHASTSCTFWHRHAGHTLSAGNLTRFGLAEESNRKSNSKRLPRTKTRQRQEPCGPRGPEHLQPWGGWHPPRPCGSMAQKLKTSVAHAWASDAVREERAGMGQISRGPVGRARDC